MVSAILPPLRRSSVSNVLRSGSNRNRNRSTNSSLGFSSFKRSLSSNSLAVNSSSSRSLPPTSPQSSIRNILNPVIPPQLPAVNPNLPPPPPPPSPSKEGFFRGFRRVVGKAVRRAIGVKSKAQQAADKKGAELTKIIKDINLGIDRGVDPSYYNQAAQILINDPATNIEGGDDYDSPLLVACSNGHYTIAKALVEKGAKVTKKDSYGLIPLQIICKNFDPNNEDMKDLALLLIEKMDSYDLTNYNITDVGTPKHVCKDRAVEVSNAISEKLGKRITNSFASVENYRGGTRRRRRTRRITKRRNRRFY